MEKLTKAQTFELNRKVRDATNQLSDEILPAKLSERDMIATEALYHKSCPTALYNWLRKTEIDDENAIIEGIVLAEIVDYINSSKESSEAFSVFKLSDIKLLYLQQLKIYGSPDFCIENILKEKTS